MAVTLLLQGRTKTFSKVPRFDLRHPKPSAKCLGSPCAIRDLRQSAEVRLAPFGAFGKPPRKWLVRRPVAPDSSRQMEAPSPPQIRRRKARARAPAIWEARGHRRESGPRGPRMQNPPVPSQAGAASAPPRPAARPTSAAARRLRVAPTHPQRPGTPRGVPTRPPRCPHPQRPGVPPRAAPHAPCPRGAPASLDPAPNRAGPVPPPADSSASGTFTQNP